MTYPITQAGVPPPHLQCFEIQLMQKSKHLGRAPQCTGCKWNRSGRRACPASHTAKLYHARQNRYRQIKIAGDLISALLIQRPARDE